MLNFEEMYNDCYVELKDGKPLFAYNYLADARRGVLYDKMAEATFSDMDCHTYEIKYLKDGRYYDLEAL